MMSVVLVVLCPLAGLALESRSEGTSMATVPGQPTFCSLAPFGDTATGHSMEDVERVPHGFTERAN